MAIAQTKTSRNTICEEQQAAIDEFLRLRDWYDKKLAKLNKQFPGCSFYLMDIQGALSSAQVAYACEPHSDRAWETVQRGLEAAEAVISDAFSSSR
ncbi:MAG: hypothetical protein U9Q81_18480 [Pseudomonadota bacterium]|nr:hypothetical protein [Pseudomonadota bacterium]